MTTATTAPKAPDTTPITVALPRDYAALWWPYEVPSNIQRLNPQTRPRLIALVRTLLEHRRELLALGALEFPNDYMLLPTFIGPGFTVLARGVEALSGHNAADVAFFGRFVVNGEAPAEREVWERARLEFGRNLTLNGQREVLQSIYDQFRKVGTNLSGRRAVLRAADEWLSWVESWLAAGGAGGDLR